MARTLKSLVGHLSKEARDMHWEAQKLFDIERTQHEQPIDYYRAAKRFNQRAIAELGGIDGRRLAMSATHWRDMQQKRGNTDD